VYSIISADNKKNPKNVTEDTWASEIATGHLSAVLAIPLHITCRKIKIQVQEITRKNLNGIVMVPRILLSTARASTSSAFKGHDSSQRAVPVGII